MGACKICKIEKENEIKTNSLKNTTSLEKNSEIKKINEQELFYNGELKEKEEKIEQLANKLSINDKKNQKYSYNTGYNYNNKGSININIANANELRVPLDLIIEAKKSLCKINIKTKTGNKITNGFFLSLKYFKDYLIVNYHIIFEDIPDGEIELEIYNHNKIKLILNKYNVKYFPTAQITIIEIDKNDIKFENIKFLCCILNLTENYDFYIKIFIFSIKNTFEEKITYSVGQIVDINGFKFCHNLINDKGYDGSPIMLISYNINEISVIGIYKEMNYSKEINNGIFIDELFKEVIKSLIKSEKKYLITFDDLFVFTFIFNSENLSINFPVVCRREDNFSTLEEKLYQKYPELIYKKLHFIANGNLIKRSSTIMENKIKEGDTILIIEEE